MVETWKDIEGHDNYEVSNMERYRNKTTKTIHDTKELKPSRQGHIKIHLKRISITFSRIVAKTFVPNPDNKPMVWNIDRDKTNNKPGNLKWMTRKEICNLMNKSKIRKMHPIIRIGKETEIYESSHAAAKWILEKQLSTSRTINKNITDVCNGYRSSTYGYKWKWYIEPIEGEIWKKHPTLKDIWCSSEGRVKNKKRLLLGCKGDDCYINIGIKRTYYKRADLIAQAFIPNPEDKPIVDHIDDDPENDHPSNLRWVTQKENIQYALNKKIYQYSKDKKTFIKEYESITIAIKQLNIGQQHISECAKGKLKSAGGFYWSYTKL